MGGSFGTTIVIRFGPADGAGASVPGLAPGPEPGAPDAHPATRTTSATRPSRGNCDIASSRGHNPMAVCAAAPRQARWPVHGPSPPTGEAGERGTCLLPLTLK